MSQGDLEGEAPQELANRLNLAFSNLYLLNRALTHRSYLNEHDEVIGDNERLEFLGDAVLDFLVAAWLYKHFPEKAEGELTRLRSALVRTEQLAEFAKAINLGSAMRLGRGERQAGGAQRDVLLCATFEALVAAIYLESGLQAVIEFIEPMLTPAAKQILMTQRDQDPKSQFQEYAQSHGLGTPQYRTVQAQGPEHAKTFEVEVLIVGEVYGSGVGHSKQQAAKAAARDALDKLGILLLS
ncbi:MAG: ribonuclease III [Anaerolineales bacterium]|nr:ribonuclease III [Anaerolineales bacterium]